MGQARPELGETGLDPGPGHRRSTGVGLTLTAALVMGAVVAGVLFLQSERTSPLPGPGDRGMVPPAAVTPSTATTTDRQDALDDLLAARSDAVLSRDQAKWLATIDPQATEFAARQAAVFQNLERVPIQSWRYQLAGNGPTLPAARLAELAADDVWVVRVVLEYRLRDSGTGEVRREQYLTVVQRGDRWLLAGDEDGGTSVDLWDLGPVHVERGERGLLLGTADATTLARFADEIDAAARRVDKLWGDQWPRTVVVMVPDDQKQMAALLGRQDATGLEQIAAVTTGEIGLDSSATAADRVIINPTGFAQLGDLGRDVVLTHELTHVATRATTSTAVPIWLSEGFADYVAYAGTGLSPRRVAKDVLDEVREGKTPSRLPDSSSFDPAMTDIAPAYSGAWLATRLIAEEHGEDKLIEFYRAVAGGTGGGDAATPASTPGSATAGQPAIDAAFASVLGTTQARFTRDWQAYLERLAS